MTRHLPPRHRRLLLFVLPAVAVTLSACSGASTPPPPATKPAPQSSTPTTPTISDSPTPTLTPTVQATAPPAGTTLATVPDGAQVVLNPAGGFSILTPSTGSDDTTTTAFDGGVTAYDVAGNVGATIVGEDFSTACGVADTGPAGVRTLLTEQLIETPAAGIVPASDNLTLTGWDPVSGIKKWQTTLMEKGPGGNGCSSADGSLAGTAVTADGLWAVIQHFGVNGNVTDVINLATGAKHDDEQAIATVGNSLAYVNTGDNPVSVTLADPATGNPQAKLVASDSSDGVDLGLSADQSPHTVPAGGVYGSPSYRGTSSHLTADSRTLLSLYSGYNVPTELTAYQLPTGKRLWRVTAPADHQWALLGDAGGRVLIDDTTDPTDNTASTETITALTVADGKSAWSVPTGDVCAVTSTQMQLAVNEQLALIDMATGTQQSYAVPTDSSYSGGGCPTETNTIGVSTDGTTVEQALTP